MEKLFIICTFDCSFQYYEETVDQWVKEQGDGIVLDYDLVKINDHKSLSINSILYPTGSSTNLKTLDLVVFVFSSVFRIKRAEHLNAKHLSILLHLPLRVLHLKVNVTSYSRNLFAKICHSIY